MLPNNFNSLNIWFKSLGFNTKGPLSKEKIKKIYNIILSWKESDLEFGGGNVLYTPKSLISLLKIRSQSSKKAIGFEEAIHYLEKMNNDTQITNMNYIRNNDDSLLWFFFDKNENVVSLVFISEKVGCNR